MTFESEENQSRGLRRFFSRKTIMVLGVIFVATGAAVFLLRLDRPAYSLTPVEDKIQVSFQSDSDSSREQTQRVYFQNTGREKIRLKKVGTSCGCTVVSHVPNDLLAPDQVVALEVAVTLPTFGKKITKLVVETDPPCAEPVEVSLLLRSGGDPLPYITVLPKSLVLTSNSPEHLFEHTFKVETREAIDSPDWLIGVDAASDAVFVELLSREEYPDNQGVVGRIYEFQFTGVGPNSPSSPLGLLMNFQKTTEAVKHMGFYSITLVYRPSFQVFPEQLLVTLRDDGINPEKQTLILSGTEETPLPIDIEIETEVDWISASVQDADSANEDEREILLSFDLPTSTEELKTSLRINARGGTNVATLNVPVLLVDERRAKGQVKSR